MKIKHVIAATLASLVVIVGVTGTAHIRRLEARVKALENTQSVQLARTRVLIHAMEQQTETHKKLLHSAKLLVAVLEPDPHGSTHAVQSLLDDSD